MFHQSSISSHRLYQTYSSVDVEFAQIQAIKLEEFSILIKYRLSSFLSSAPNSLI